MIACFFHGIFENGIINLPITGNYGSASGEIYLCADAVDPVQALRHTHRTMLTVHTVYGQRPFKDDGAIQLFLCRRMAAGAA